MALSASQSPIMGTAHRAEELRHLLQLSASPQQQLSKRDKRRSMLADRLEDLTRQFSQHRDLHYREQLQAIQIDMNLIMEADAHTKEELVNGGTEIDALLKDNMQKISMKSIGPVPPPRAGKAYADFAKEVNDAMEERDSNLAMHKRDFDVKMGQLAATDTYRRKLAALEHHALSSTLRDRLINSVINKKNRLSRDRETIEIGESNAHLLHPSQFGLANPASPGGMHSKRATRHRRDADELPSFADGKRKRKAGDGDDSSAPSRHRGDNGSSTPLWNSEKSGLHSAQVDSALYSIDKLFTEKELAMNYNQAALAAHKYMQRHQPYNDDIDGQGNGKSESGSDLEKTVQAGATGDQDTIEDGDSPQGADMVRQFSHATRSTRGAVAPSYATGAGPDNVGDLNYPWDMDAITKQTPRMPLFIASMAQKGYVKSDSANQPPGLSVDEANAELDIIRRGRMFNDNAGFGRNLEAENGGKPLLEAATMPRRYDFFVKSDNSELLEKVFAISAVREGGEAMSKQSSLILSEIGGYPMSRQGTGSRSRRQKPGAGAV